MKKIENIKGKKLALLSLLVASISLTGCDYNNVSYNGKNLNISSVIGNGTEDDIEYSQRLISYGINTNNTLSDEYKEELVNFFNIIIERELPSRQLAFKIKARINTSDYTDLTFEEIIQNIFEIETIDETYEFIEYYYSSVSKSNDDILELKLV